MVSGGGGGMATAGGGLAAGGGSGQEFCLKWNNHRSTILSVMDMLLEEESLVDVTLSADGQFIRAHRVILSACSPYFRSLFKSSFLQDKHPVIVMKDVDFENLKSLVEYMYKGEANVPQLMLPSFIQTAESLQIRGLAEGASKQKLEQVAELNSLAAAAAAPPPPLPLHLPAAGLHQHLAAHAQLQTPTYPKAELATGGGGKHRDGGSGGGILAARLAKMVENPPMQQMFNDFHEHLAIAAASRAAAAAAAVGHSGLVAPPPMKRPRKTPLLTSSPIKLGDMTTMATNGGGGGNGGGMKQEISVKKDLLAKNSRMSPKVTNIMAPGSLNSSPPTPIATVPSSPRVATTPPCPPNTTHNNNNNNNNYESDSDVLKIDEDRDNNSSRENNKENRLVLVGGGGEEEEEEDDDIAELDQDNGLEDSEEEAISHKELAERGGPSVGFINPWTGEEIPGIHGEADDDDSMHGEGGLGPVFPLLDNSLSSLSRSMELMEDSKHDPSRDPMTNKYACARCGRSYLHQATLVRHQRYECGISASYPCQLCGRKFKRRDVLKGHMEKCMNKSAVGGGGGGGLGSPISLGGGGVGGGGLPSGLLSSAGLLVGPGGSLITSGGLGRSSPLVPSTVTSMVPYSGGM